MRHPFFNMTRLFLEEGESDFNPLEGHEGIVVTLGPNTSFFDRPGRFCLPMAGNKNCSSSERPSYTAAVVDNE